MLNALFGTASQVDRGVLAKEFAPILAPEEEIHLAYRVVRDLIVFTDRRLILVDKQGLTGKKVQYHSIPYRSITHFSVETSGRFDADAELKIWISSMDHPVEKEFRKDSNIFAIQQALAAYVLR